MDKNKIKEYSDKYKKIQLKMAVLLMCFIILISVGIIIGGILITIFNNEKSVILYVVSIIMLIAGALNIILGIKFYKITKIKIEKMKPEESAYRYSKITGNK